MDLYAEILNCSLCTEHLPHKPKPILQFGETAKILIVGQAPGRLAHESGIPWNDPSGDRLRMWLGVSKEEFYNKELVAIVPMGFCYPGKGKSGDLPPRLECRARWLDSVISRCENVQLIVVVGNYAKNFFFPDEDLPVLIKDWAKEGEFIVLPHPSPRNNIWLSKNKWIESQVLPDVKNRVRKLLNDC